MDIASLLSIIGGIAMVIFGVLSSNSFDITAMQMYIDPASVVITFGGSICSTIGVFQACRWNQRIQVNFTPVQG